VTTGISSSTPCWLIACEGRELGHVLSDQYRRDRRALAAEDRLDGCHVALTERVVLREDSDGLALDVVEERSRRGHVLCALTARAEGVLVDAGDGVGRGGAGDVQHLVLRGLLGHRERHSR
jgi:hypothetical protein